MPVRTLVVDDSPSIRAMLTRILSADPEIEVVARVADGQQALNVLGEAQPDVVLLDLEMPVMDGMTALPKLLRADSRLAVIVASAVTQRGAAEAMAARFKATGFADADIASLARPRSGAISSCAIAAPARSGR